MSEVQEGTVRVPTTRGELIRFGVLVVIMVGVVLGVALLRPLIFDRIVPAVLGWGQPMAPVSVNDSDKPATDSAPAAEPPAAVEEGAPAVAEPATEEAGAESEAEAGAESAEDGSTEEGTTVFIPTVSDSAPESLTPANGETGVTHTVQPGENLTAIAERYGVTIEALIAANDISNPNRIAVGTALQIPQE